MGYVVATEGINFTIPAEQAETAVAILVALEFGEHSQPESSATAALEAILEDIGFELHADRQGVALLSYLGKSRYEEVTIEALAGLVADGSFIEWRGEEDERWRQVVRDGKLYYQYASIEWLDSASNPVEPPRFVTIIPVMYRDAANYKVHGSIECDGVLTASQAAELAKALDDGLYYIPAQVGLTHWGDGAWPSFPCEDDHCWHELELDCVQVVPARPSSSLGDARIDRVGAVDQFVARMSTASAVGWNASLHAPS